MSSYHDDRCTKVAIAKPAAASKLVFQWAKTGLLNYSQFMDLLPLIERQCGCEVCGGERGGCPGNENVVNGTVICDYCWCDQQKNKVV